MGVFTMLGRIAFFPVWLPWRAYRGLWWAFGTPPDGRPEPGRFTQLGGFAATVSLGVVLALACAVLAGERVLEPGRAWIAWVVGTGAGAIGTVLVGKRTGGMRARAAGAWATAKVAAVGARASAGSVARAGCHAALRGAKGACARAATYATDGRAAADARKWCARGRSACRRVASGLRAGVSAARGAGSTPTASAKA